jgi:predicted site-specific integrase-resolvase
MNGYSTREAAQRLGLSLISLKRYVAAGKIPTPPLSKVGGVSVRLWSDEDIQRVKEILPKIANGRKTRHQREKQKRQKKKRPKQ